MRSSLDKLQRIGRFNIDATVFHDEFTTRAYKAFMRLLDPIIWEANYRKDFDGIAYLAISDLFDEVPVGTSAPRYPIHKVFKKYPKTEKSRGFIAIERFELGKPGEEERETFIE